MRTSKFFTNKRFDIFPKGMVNGVVIDLPAPLNLSYLWNFGSLLGLYLVIQLSSGLFLSMHYVSSSFLAFESVDLMNREIGGGWFMRYIHISGASGFFMFLMFHLGRGLFYGSFFMVKTWLSGVTLLLLSMGAAFLGYVLPWGQMSYWGATVMTNFLSVLPYAGSYLVIWVWGSFSVDYPTLTRFFSLHFLLPFLMLGLVIIHISFLHLTGSNNPLNGDSQGDKILFSPYFLLKDAMGFFLSFLGIFNLFLFYPELVLEHQKFMESNPLVTPPHMQPEWYFLAAYAVLRAMPNKLGGVMALVLFVAMFYILPFLSFTPHFSIKNSFFLEVYWWLWVSTFLFLTWVGAQPVEDPYIFCSRFGGLLYFFFFFLLFSFTFS